jgi:hypothetical protein
LARFVEAKSFVSGSLTRDLALAVGQFLIYRALLEKSEPDREVWLALPREVYDDYFCREAVQWIVARYGWQQGRRVRGPTVYVRLKNGKFWIEEDMTDLAIADRLVEAGVPKKDIVLGFQAPERRKYADFAAA